LLEEVEVDVVDRIGNDRVRNTNIDDTGADTGADTKFDKIDGVEQETGGDDEESEEDSEEEEQQNLGENSGEGEENERGEFLLDAVAQKEVAANEEKRGDSSDEQEDIRLVDNKQEGDNENEEESHNMERDLSSYDTWMGILSSSSVKYFVRIVPSSEVGVVSITDRS
jgi:cobalamin biosynthesis protein CobT